MMTFLIIAVSFSIGFALGSWMKGIMFDRLDWQCLKWSTDSFGYRTIPIGTKLYKGDKVLMALNIDPGHWPDEGTVYGGDE